MIINKDQFKSYSIHISVGHLFLKEVDVFSVLLNQYLHTTHPMYPSRKSFNQALEEMYGLKISMYSNIEGNYLVHQIRCKFIQPSLVSSTSLLKDVLTFITHMIFHAKLDDTNHFQEEKTRLIQHYESIRDDKQTYIDYVYEETLLQHVLDMYTFDEKVDLIKHTSLTDIQRYYEQYFKQANIVMFASGNFTEEDITVMKHVLEPYEQGQIYPQFKGYRLHEKKEITLKMPVSQAIMHLGYHTDIMYHHPNKTAFQIFNELLGGHADSRLFKEIREKRGLCYSIYSYINLHLGTLTISTGVDISRLEETKIAIQETIDTLMSLDVTEEELEQTKAYMIHQILSSLDRQSTYIQRAYKSHLYQEEYDLEKRIEAIHKVTKSDLKNVAGTLKHIIIHQVIGED